MARNESGATEHGRGAGPGDGRHRRAMPEHDDSYARGKFGGFNLGAAFFGWLVAIGIAVILSSIIGAVAAAVGADGTMTRSEAQRQAGTIGVVAAIVLFLVLAVAYYAGGYVAGRMSRFDGAKQGLLTWLIGLLVTVLATVLGWVFGSEYNLLDRVSLPNLPVSTDAVTTGGIITAVAILVGTLLAAMAGGKIGHRYHDRVDRAAYR